MSFVLDGDVLALTDWRNSICKSCQRYRKSVDFCIPNINEPVVISLQGSLFRRQISAFPQNIEWFVKQQGLNACFGTADHNTPGRSICSPCESRRKSRVQNTRKRKLNIRDIPYKRQKPLPAIPLSPIREE